MEKEIWKAVPGYEGLYEASDLGRVRNVARRVRTRPGRILKGWPIPHTNGRTAVQLYKRGVRKVFTVANVIARTFVGPPPTERYQANHKDGDRKNNRPDNLDWVTRSENHQHAAKMGLRADGEKSPHAKLSAADVDQIRHLLKTKSGKSIARQFNVSKATISRIKTGRLWKYTILRSV